MVLFVISVNLRTTYKICWKWMSNTTTTKIQPVYTTPENLTANICAWIFLRVYVWKLTSTKCICEHFLFHLNANAISFQFGCLNLWVQWRQKHVPNYSKMILYWIWHYSFGWQHQCQIQTQKLCEKTQCIPSSFKTNNCWDLNR